MSKSLIRSSLVLGLVVVSAASFAQNASGTSNTGDSRFTSATGNLSNITISNPRLVKWGPYKKNTLEFVTSTFTTNAGQPFKVGSLTWMNRDKDQNGNMSVDLNVGLNYGARGTGLMALNLKYTESKYGSDFFTLPGAAKLGSATIDGKLYDVSLTGFKHKTGNGNISGNQWCNTGCDTIDIYAKLEAAPVPEPASMAVLGMGIAAIIRKRRTRK